MTNELRAALDAAIETGAEAYKREWPNTPTSEHGLALGVKITAPATLRALGENRAVASEIDRRARQYVIRRIAHPGEVKPTAQDYIAVIAGLLEAEGEK